MKSFLSVRVLLASGVLALGIAGSGWAAETKAPGKKSSKSAAKEAPPAVEAPKDDAEKVPLKLAVDRKPLNRDAADRVSYAPIVKRTASSVVYVHSTKTVKAPDLSPFLNDPMLRKFFEQLPGGPGSEEGGGGGGARKGGRIPNPQPQVGLGSGVVITPDGYILTNNHVIEGADEVKVSIGESTKKYNVTIVGRDSLADIAVLKIEPTAPLTPATLGDSEQLQVGDVVLAIGNPFGVGQSVSRGIVSALSRGVGIGVLEDFIQTDAAINPGNSGGALLDTEGRLVGINTAILSRSGGFNGVGFAIPINLVRNIAEQIVNTGRVSRGFLGVVMQDLDEQLVAAFKTEQGAIINEVQPDSPAEKAGLQPGDVITKIDSTEIRDMRHVLLTVGQLSPDTEIKVDYLRDGKAESATLKLARRPDQSLAADDGPPKDVGVLNGVTVAEITPEVREQLKIPENIRGAIVTDVESSSPSARAGIQEGDVILDLDGRPVRNASEAVRLSEEIQGPLVRVYLWRDGTRKYLGVDESKK